MWGGNVASRRYSVVPQRQAHTVILFEGTLRGKFLEGWRIIISVVSSIRHHFFVNKSNWVHIPNGVNIQARIEAVSCWCCRTRWAAMTWVSPMVCLQLSCFSGNEWVSVDMPWENSIGARGTQTRHCIHKAALWKGSFIREEAVSTGTKAGWDPCHWFLNGNHSRSAQQAGFD